MFLRLVWLLLENFDVFVSNFKITCATRVSDVTCSQGAVCTHYQIPRLISVL